MTWTDRLGILALTVAVAFMVGVVVVLATGSGVRSEPEPTYLEVEVPDRVVECLVFEGGLSCNWGDPLVEVSSIGPIERPNT